jgi:hypothetical protein
VKKAGRQACAYRPAKEKRVVLEIFILDAEILETNEPNYI